MIQMVIDKVKEFLFLSDNMLSMFSMIEKAKEFKYNDYIVEYKTHINNAIYINNLRITLNNGKEIYLNDINFNSSRIHLSGKNGCGKTTLCKLFQGNINPHISVSGNITILSPLGDKIDVFITHQNSEFPPKQSILEYISGTIYNKRYAYY
jgi:ABC-type bacteriocin/lantibiotic exporter with double-glycine peptidase domain